MKKLKPVHDKIVIKPLDKDGNEDVTESGIILPDSVQGGKLIEGEVIAVGGGMYTQTGQVLPCTFKVGFTILYHSHNHAQEYKLNGEDVLIMSQNEVLAIIKDK